MPSLAEFQHLPLAHVAGPLRLARVAPRASLTDPAIEMMTDLDVSPCVTIDHLDTVPFTLQVMQRAGVRMAFVTGLGELIGLVTADDLQGERPLLRAMADRVAVEELAVEQVMHSLHDLLVVDAWQIEHSRLGNVAATMRSHGLGYLLVAERSSDGSARIRGLFSARRLEAALDVEMTTGHPLRSFAELEALLVR